MISSFLRLLRLAPAFLVLTFGPAQTAEPVATKDRCEFGARGSFTSSAGGDRIDVSTNGVVFASSTSEAQLTVKAKYQVAQVRIAKLSMLDFHDEVVSLYPQAFEKVRLPACIMLIRNGAHKVGLLPVLGGILFVEVSDHDPPTVQVFLSR
jgi:hypothetical protein